MDRAHDTLACRIFDGLVIGPFGRCLARAVRPYVAMWMGDRERGAGQCRDYLTLNYV